MELADLHASDLSVLISVWHRPLEHHAMLQPNVITAYYTRAVVVPCCSTIFGVTRNIGLFQEKGHENNALKPDKNQSMTIV